MREMSLQKALGTLGKTYIGKDKEGKYVLAKGRLDSELEFLVAMDRVSIGLKNKEITEKQFIDELKEAKV